MRLFIAINFSPDARSRLLALQSELRSKSERGDFTLPENIHLTLVFLGECSLKQCAAAKAAMDAVCFEPFSIEVDRMGYFGRGDGNIWWAGVRESRPMLELQRELTNKLAGHGFAPENRRYSPHITLGRRVVTGADGWKIEPFSEAVKSIELMKSERIQGKLTYTCLASKAARL